MRVNCIKFLGVFIETQPNWTDHIMFIKSKISKRIGTISKAKRVLKSETLLTLYNSFILPYFTFCIEVWGSTFDYLLESLNLLQRKIVRIIACSANTAHTEPLFRRLKILKMSQLYVKNISLFCLNSTLNYCHLFLRIC